MIFINSLGFACFWRSDFLRKKTFISGWKKYICLIKKRCFLADVWWENTLESALGVLLTLARQPDPDPSMKTHVRDIRQRSPNRYRCEWQLLLYRLHGLRPTRHRVAAAAAAAENPLPGTRPLAIHVPRKFHNPFPNPHSDKILIILLLIIDLLYHILTNIDHSTKYILSEWGF